MKTFYLLGWLISAVLLAFSAENFKEAMLLYILNIGAPFILLVLRIAMLHVALPEKTNLPV